MRISDRKRMHALDGMVLSERRLDGDGKSDLRNWMVVEREGLSGDTSYFVVPIWRLLLEIFV